MEIQNATSLVLTKLDVLSYLDEIKVCTAYELDGIVSDKFPFPSELKSAKPVYKSLCGWKRDISKVKKWEDLPVEARRYVSFIEQCISCPIDYISVGPERDSLIKR